MAVASIEDVDEAVANDVVLDPDEAYVTSRVGDLEAF